MSDGNGNEKLEPIIPESKDLHMEITFKEGKGIEVKGPGNGDMYNEPICLWMLDKAKDFIKDHDTKASMSKVQIHKPGMLNRMGGAFGKHK
jgi:hypothetical protein